MEIKKLFVIFKTHLDIGYTDLAANVIRRYGESYLPEAVRTAKALREAGGEERLVWTTGSWLIAEYLRTHGGAEREALCEAIRQGDVSWHGLPFTTHAEMMGAELFRYGLSLSGKLDAQFGRRTIAAKMTDVPGHTRAMIPLLRQAGIEFLHIGVNPASRMPRVPGLFRWRCDSGEAINVMYQGDYGAFDRIGESDAALHFAHTGDNLGVQSPEEIGELFAALKRQLPGAEVIAANLNDLAREVRKIEDTLPVITEEIGDTWIHGIGTDPKKASQFKALERFWESLPAGEDRDVLGRGLLLVPEHTWGLNGQLNLTDHAWFARPVFRKKRRELPAFRRMEASWQEQRAFLTDAVKALSGENRRQALAGMQEAARGPALPGGHRDMGEPLEGGKPQGGEDMDGRVLVCRPVHEGEEVSCAGYAMRFNRQGEIVYLEREGRLLADWAHRLLTLRYEQFCMDDYKRFYGQFCRKDVDWAREDFTKIGMEQGVDCYRRYEPEAAKVHASPEEIIVTYAFPRQAWEEYGCPEKFDLIIREAADGLEFDLAWFNKPANRMAEAIWVGFRPMAAGKRVSKLGSPVDSRKVVEDGQCRLHGTDYGVLYEDLAIETLDAPLVALQEPSLLHFVNEKPQDEEGVYFNLYNNVWATNFPMWYEEDARFRFVLHG